MLSSIVAWVHVVCERLNRQLRQTALTLSNMMWTLFRPCPCWHNGFCKTVFHPFVPLILVRFRPLHMCKFHRKSSHLGKEKPVHLCLGLIDEDSNLIDVVHVDFWVFFVSMFMFNSKKDTFQPFQSLCGLRFSTEKRFFMIQRNCCRLCLYWEKGCIFNYRNLDSYHGCFWNRLFCNLVIIPDCTEQRGDRLGLFLRGGCQINKSKHD